MEVVTVETGGRKAGPGSGESEVAASADRSTSTITDSLTAGEDRIDPTAPAKVLSLSAARARRAQRRLQNRPTLPELEGLDMRGVDVDRLTTEGREHYWFNVNKYARHLFVSSCELSMKDSDHPYSPICVHHVREAEMRRMRMAPSQSRKRYLGLLFLFDALQIVGAAACGALATKPDMFKSAGMVPLAIAITLTVTVFLFREAIATKTGEV